MRGEGSLVAFQAGRESPAEAGFRIVGAHTDSPNLRLKPRPDRSAEGYRQLAVEPYGGRSSTPGSTAISRSPGA